MPDPTTSTPETHMGFEETRLEQFKRTQVHKHFTLLEAKKVQRERGGGGAQCSTICVVYTSRSMYRPHKHMSVDITA